MGEDGGKAVVLMLLCYIAMVFVRYLFIFSDCMRYESHDLK